MIVGRDWNNRREKSTTPALHGRSAKRVACEHEVIEQGEAQMAQHDHSERGVNGGTPVEDFDPDTPGAMTSRTADVMTARREGRGVVICVPC